MSDEEISKGEGGKGSDGGPRPAEPFSFHETPTVEVLKSGTSGSAGGTSFKGSPVQEIRGWDRYEILELLGEGGMGTVYKAFDPSLKRHVALKFLRGADPTMLQRFLLEAQAQAQVDHEHVCRVYEVGLHEARPYIAMQFIAGRSLLEAAPEMVLEQRLRVMRDVALAVHEAHRHGLIHRDIKPSNIMVERTEEGGWRPFVMDFGLAREQAAPGLTVDGTIMGTPAYMAPEQVLGDKGLLDRRTDVYGLGVTLYELLVGGVPFEGTAVEIILRVVSEEPSPPRKVLPSLSEDLETIVLKCMEKEPQRRYESARALAEDLDRFLAGEPVTARRATLLYRLGKKAKKHRVAVALSGVALSAILVLGGMWLHAWRSAARTAELAQQFGIEVERVESALRFELMAPLHDVRPAKARVRQRMESIRSRMEEVGGIAQGPGSYALGRGHLALGEYEKARECLEKAWQRGYRTPQVAYALGQALGMLYQMGMEQVARNGDEQVREALKKRLRETLRDPALAYLKRSAGLTLESPAYAEGLIAFYDGQNEVALRKAREAAKGAPWFYEARRLAGDVQFQMAKGRLEKGDDATAAEALAASGKSYEEGIAIARSDAGLYERDAGRYLESFELARMKEGSPEAELRKALAAIDLALVADPDSPGAWRRKAYAYAVWAEEQGLRGLLGQAEKDAAEAVVFGERAVRCGPNEPETHLELGVALEIRGALQEQTGKDPSASLEGAIRTYRRVIELAPGLADGFINLGNALMTRERYESKRGQDPRPTLLEGVAAYEQALRIVPVDANCLSNMGVAYRRMAEYEMRQGLDARPSCDRSVEYYRRALQIKPDNPVILANLGMAYVSLADFQVESAQDPTAALDEAVGCLQKSIAIKPDVAYARNILGNVHSGRAEWEMNSGRDPVPELERAAAAYLKALEINPAYAMAQSNLGMVELLRGRYALWTGGRPDPFWARALQAFREAVRLRPGYANAHRNTGRLFAERAEARERAGASPAADLSSARAALEKAGALNPADAWVPLVLARTQLVEGRWASRRGASPAASFAACRTALQKAAGLNPRDARVALTEAQLCLEEASWDREHGGDARGGFERGVKAAESALAIQKNMAEAFLARAALRVQQGKAGSSAADREKALAEASSDLERAIALNRNLAREAQPLQSALSAARPR